MKATKVKVAAAVIAAATLSGGAAVWATTSAPPSTPTTIWACKINVTGLVRVVDGPGQCSSRYETPLSWNVVGPKGATGATGPAGAKGATAYAWWNSNATLLEGSSPGVNGVVFARDSNTNFAVPGVFCFDLVTPATAVVANLTVGFADSYLMAGGAFSSLGTITLSDNQQVTCPDGYQDAIVADSRNDNGFPTTFSAAFF